MAKDFFEAYVACLLMFFIPIAIVLISRIRGFIDCKANAKEMEKDKEI
jgi:uncharacterized membrane protein